MLTPRHLLTATALVLSACGGPEETAGTHDPLVLNTNFLNPCLSAPADQSLSFGTARSWRLDVSANSGTSGFASYMHSDRACQRFVVDVALPASHPKAAVGVDRFGSDVFADIETPEICATVELDVWLYSRIDGGSWSYHGKKSYRGEWRSFGAYCRAEPIDGGADTLDVPAAQSQSSRQFRVLTVGTAFGGFPIHVVTAGHITL